MSPEDLEARELCFDDEVTRLYDHFADELYRHVRGRLGHEDAEEVVQDAFLAARRHWSRVRRFEKPVAYVYRAAHHLSVDVLARNRRTARLGEQPPAGAAPAECEDHSPAVEEQLWVGDAVERLSPRQRETVALHYWEGLPLAAIAERLGLEIGTVKKTLFEARTQLRRALGPP